MRVSYTATIIHLQNIQLISSFEQFQLSRQQPRSLKEQLVDRPMADWRAHVWVPQEAEMGKLRVDVADEIIIGLPENRTTPFRWTSVGRSGVVELVNDEYHPSHASRLLVGSGGVRRLTFRALNPGRWELPLALMDRFDVNEPAAGSIAFGGVVRRAPAELHSAFLTRTALAG